MMCGGLHVEISKSLLTFGQKHDRTATVRGLLSMNVVELCESVTVVDGLEAKDGSPIIDIKASCR